MKHLHPVKYQPALMVSGDRQLIQGLPLILTKFTPPRSAGEQLQRPRLLEQLDHVRGRRMALICAGAGFGKTTLLVHWYQQLIHQGARVAWLALDEDDDAVERFIPYLLQALRPLYQGWDADFWSRMEETAASNSQRCLIELINQLLYCPHDLYLVIDDFHVINDPGVQDALSYLLKHMPAVLHLIVGSRSHPNLTLSWLQAQDQLVLIDDQDLRFTLEETRSYFSQSIKVPISGSDSRRLLSVTEGWVAGIKIASLSAGLQLFPGKLIDNLRGGTRAIARYLNEVVFNSLPKDVLDFLVQTSVLKRLNVRLCNAVTGRDDGQVMLAWIEQHNLFLSALDEQGYWFRYHPLLQECLCSRLAQFSDTDVKQLHERASQWFVEQKLWSEAVRHALAAGKSVPGSRQEGAGAQSLAEEGDIDTLLRWVRHLPANIDMSRIDIQINLAWALAHHFRFEESRQVLDGLNQLLSDHCAELPHSTWIKLQVVRAICEGFAENISQSLAIVEPLLDEVPCGDTWVDGLVCNILSYCYVIEQRYAEALQVQQHMPHSDEPPDNLFVSVYRAFIIAQCHLHLGSLDEAVYCASGELRRAERYIGPRSTSGATLAPLLAEIAYERGQIDALDGLLSDKLELIDRFSPPDALRYCYVSLARQALFDDTPQEAERLLEHARRLAVSRKWPRLQAQLLAEQIRVRLQRGDLTGAGQLQQQLDLLADSRGNDVDPACLPTIVRYVVLSESRLLIAREQALKASRILATLVAQEEGSNSWLTVVRLRALWALALWQSGEVSFACATLSVVLPLVGSQALQRGLLDIGEALYPLLVRLRKSLPAKSEESVTLDRLLGEYPQENEAQNPLTEDATLSLSERECQALSLISEGRSNKEIARELEISTETVKWHLKNIYAKLNVRSRTQAMNYAIKMKLQNP